jgi:hypothetical protein
MRLGDHNDVTIAMSTLTTVLLVWAAVLAVLVAVLAFGTGRRRRPEPDEVPERRGERGDRRRGEGDRRIGLPDLRRERVERRSGSGDRRHGVADRRRVLGPV